MKLTRKQRNAFREALDFYLSNEWTLWLCPTFYLAINDRKLAEECRTILHRVFNDYDREIIWHYVVDCDGNVSQARNARIIALYTLLYAPELP